MCTSMYVLLSLFWMSSGNCAHTTSDVQTSKLAQRDTILACCWYHWCEYCRFVIFQLFFLKYLWKLKKQYWHQYLWASMCSTLSLLVVEWKLRAHTASDVQTSKLAQCYTILACCWYQWCEYCRFVIFQLFFLKIFVQSSKSNVYISIFELRCVVLSLFWLSSGNWAHTLQATYKHQNLHNVILY